MSRDEVKFASGVSPKSTRKSKSNNNNGNNNLNSNNSNNNSGWGDALVAGHESLFFGEDEVFLEEEDDDYIEEELTNDDDDEYEEITIGSDEDIGGDGDSSSYARGDNDGSRSFDSSAPDTPFEESQPIIYGPEDSAQQQPEQQQQGEEQEEQQYGLESQVQLNDVEFPGFRNLDEQGSNHRKNGRDFKAPPEMPTRKSSAAASAAGSFGVDSKKDEIELPKLVGREPELSVLKDAATRITNPSLKNPKDIVWISGPSGIGKTAVVDKFVTDHGHMTWFCRGTFEEVHLGTEPFSAIIDSLINLVDFILSDWAEHSKWKKRIHEALLHAGDGGQILAAALPEISPLLELHDDPNSPVQLEFDITTQRRFDRLRYAIRTLLEVICQYKPVVMILDDIHWAREESILIIESILASTKLQNFLFIGCHRGVKTNHPLTAAKERLKETRPTHLYIDNLSWERVEDMVLRYIQQKEMGDIPKRDKKLNNLAKAIHVHAVGNPLVVSLMIPYLEHKELLCGDTGEWQWDNKKIAGDTTIPTNSIELATARIQSLSQKARLALTGAAYLGLAYFRTEALFTVIHENFRRDVKDGNKECPFRDVESLNRLLNIASTEGVIEKVSLGVYKFGHDSIRKGAQSLLPKGRKLKLRHFHLGAKLSAMASHSDRNQQRQRERLKTLALYQLNLSASVLKSEKEKTKLAKMNLDTAGLSISKSAFHSAVRSLDAARGYLDADKCWSEENCELTLKIYMTWARMKFCCGLYAEARDIVNEILKHVTTEREQVSAYQVLIFSLLKENKIDDAFTTNLDFLDKLGVEFPRNSAPKYVAKDLEEIKGILDGRSDAELLTLPRMIEKRNLTLMKFVAQLAEIAWLKRDNSYQALAALKMIRDTMEYGSSPVTCLAFAIYAACLARRKRCDEASRYGRLAQMMAKNDNIYGGQAVTHYYYGVHHWRGQFRSSLEHLADVSNASTEAGYIEHFSFWTGTLIANWLVSGSNLRLLVAKMQSFQDVLMDHDVAESYLVVLPTHMTLKLMNKTDPTSMAVFAPNINLAKKWEESGHARATQYLYLLQMITAFFFNKMEIADELRQKLYLNSDGVWVTWQLLVEGIIAFSLSKTGNQNAARKYYDKGCSLMDQLADLADDGNPNCDHMFKLLRAEEATCRPGPPVSPGTVRRNYETAIGAAVKGGFVHHRALANERAGIYFLEFGDDDLAAMYLSRAHAEYKRWGAFAKVIQLEQDYEGYVATLEPPPMPPPPRGGRSRPHPPPPPPPRREPVEPPPSDFKPPFEIVITHDDDVSLFEYPQGLGGDQKPRRPSRSFDGAPKRSSISDQGGPPMPRKGSDHHPKRRSNNNNNSNNNINGSNHSHGGPRNQRNNNAPRKQAPRRRNNNEPVNNDEPYYDDEVEELPEFEQPKPVKKKRSKVKSVASSDDGDRSSKAVSKSGSGSASFDEDFEGEYDLGDEEENRDDSSAGKNKRRNKFFRSLLGKKDKGDDDDDEGGMKKSSSSHSLGKKDKKNKNGSMRRARSLRGLFGKRGDKNNNDNDDDHNDDNNYYDDYDDYDDDYDDGLPPPPGSRRNSGKTSRGRAKSPGSFRTGSSQSPHATKETTRRSKSPHNIKTSRARNQRSQRNDGESYDDSDGKSPKRSSTASSNKQQRGKSPGAIQRKRDATRRAAQRESSSARRDDVIGKSPKRPSRNRAS